MEVLEIKIWRNAFSEDDCNFEKLQEYLDFVNEAVERYNPDRYSEWHHIVPKCIDCDEKHKDQGVRINGKDHFLAHMKLAECFSGDKKRKLSYALMRMKSKLSLQGEDISEEYEESRRLYSESMKGNTYSQGCHRPHSEETRKKIGDRTRGRVLSEETRKKISQSKKGKSVSGYHWSEEARQRISIIRRRDNLSEETHKKKSKATSFRNSGRVWMTNGEVDRLIDPETRLYDELISLGYYLGRRKVSQETKNKKSLSVSGKCNPCYGKKLCNNGIINKYVSKEVLDQFLSDNPEWSLGKCKGVVE